MSQEDSALLESEDALYMTAPEAKSIRGFIEGLTILSKYVVHGLDEKWFCQAEHDSLYLHFKLDRISRTSEDGRRLIALGFSVDEENEQWVWHT